MIRGIASICLGGYLIYLAEVCNSALCAMLGTFSILIGAFLILDTLHARKVNRDIARMLKLMEEHLYQQIQDVDEMMRIQRRAGSIDVESRRIEHRRIERPKLPSERDKC